MLHQVRIETREASVEIVQIFLPWRSASVADVFSDAIGATAGAGLDALFAQIALRSRHGGQ